MSPITHEPFWKICIENNHPEDAETIFEKSKDYFEKITIAAALSNYYTERKDKPKMAKWLDLAQGGIAPPTDYSPMFKLAVLENNG